MVDFLYDMNARLWRDGVATELAPLVVVISAVEFVRRGTVVAFREVYFRDLEVVLGLAGRVCAE